MSEGVGLEVGRADVDLHIHYSLGIQEDGMVLS